MAVLSPVKTVTKQEFINALRSGEYEQNTDGRMMAGSKMCAMMVFHALSKYLMYQCVYIIESLN